MQVVNHTFFWESMSPNGGGEWLASKLGGQRALARTPAASGGSEGNSSGAELHLRGAACSCCAAHTHPPAHNAAPSSPHLPAPAGKPTGKVAEAIDRDLGGYDKFVEAFKAAGAWGCVILLLCLPA